MYEFNKQGYRYVVVVFFSIKISIVSLVLTGYGFVLLCIMIHVLHAFHTARLFNTRLPLAVF